MRLTTTHTTNNLHAFSRYRFHFNGKETDNEVYGEGNAYDYGFRIYNPRLGKFLSVDPLTKSYPWYTPYQFAGNTSIQAIDLDGLEEYFVVRWYENGKLTSTAIIKVPNEYQIEGMNGTIYLELERSNPNDLRTYKQFISNADPNTRILEKNVNWGLLIDNKNKLINGGDYEENNRPYEQDIIDKLSKNERTIIRSSDDTENITPGFSHSAFMTSIKPVDIFFENNEYNLNDLDKDKLSGTANVLKAYPSLSATVIGNTDANHTPDYNQNLGQKRADAVTNYLKATGVKNKIDTKSNGASSPRGSNNTSAGMSLNRNAQIQVNYPQKGM